MKTVEFLIDYKDQYYIAHLAISEIIKTPDGKLRAAKASDETQSSIVWVERDGSIICLQGEEYSSYDLRSFPIH